MRHLPLRVCAVTGVLGEPIWAGNSVAALDGARQITLVSGHWVCLTKFLILLVLFISFSTRCDLAWPFLPQIYAHHPILVMASMRD